MAQDLPVSLDEGWADRAPTGQSPVYPQMPSLYFWCFIVEELLKEEEITILEMGSGMGILGATFLTSLAKKWITWEWKWMIC